MNKNINSFLAIGLIVGMSILIAYLLCLNAMAQFEVFNQTQNINNSKEESNSFDYKYSLKEENCTIKNCLLFEEKNNEIAGKFVGVARVEGYYKKVTKSTKPYGCEDGDSDEFCKEYDVTCEEFVITKGGENIFSEEGELNNAEKSIAINSENSDYKILTKDESFNLNETERKKLINSSVENLVELTILKYKPNFGTEVGLCFSDNAIIRVD